MRILCDMDDVVAECTAYWLTLLNRYYGEELRPQDITDWHLWKFCKNATREQVYSHLADPGFFLHLEPVPGAIPSLKKLQDAGHEVVFVTACQHGHADKRRWIQNHLPGFDLRNVIFAERKELINGDILIDDRIENLEQWKHLNPTSYPICFARPHNHGYLGGKAFSWEGVMVLINLLEELTGHKG